MEKMKMHIGEHYMMIGSTGSGKTYFARNFLLKQFSRVLVIDSEDMEFADYNQIKADPQNIARKLPKDKNFHWRYVPDLINAKQEMEYISQSLLEYGHEVVIYIDEITDFSDAHSISPWLSALIRKARKRKISVIIATQRPQGVNKWLFNNSIWKQFFYIQPFDLHYLDELWKGISEIVSQVSWKSYESVLISPDGIVHRLEKVK